MQIIGKYEVVQELGAGGMGIVYKALHREHGHPVAIKMIGNRTAIHATLHGKLPHIPDGRDVVRRMMLVKEARLASELNHPNIVRVFDYGVHAGLLYVVMEYLEGKSLDLLLRALPPLGLSQKIEIVAQMCDALGFAHAQGVVHRDVKPANIFVLSDGGVRVLDFGLAAKMAEVQAGSGGFAGTPNYMAPESVSGQLIFDAKVDIWAAGATLYELITGRPPFAAPSIGQTLLRIMNAPIPPLPRETPRFEEIERIMGLALAKNPGERYKAADELAGELHRLARELIGAEAAPVGAFGPERGVELSDPTYLIGGLDFDIGLSGTRSAVSTSTRTLRTRRLLQRLDRFGYSFMPLGVLTTVSIFFYGLWIFVNFSEACIMLGFAVALRLGGYVFLDLSQLPLTFLAYLEALPRCRNCRSSMREKSRWTRFAHSDDAVNLAFSDCVAALEQNLWEDAAKLLFLHAHETSPTITNLLVSPPIRYHLDFFECQSCDQQCARVTIDDKSDDDWHPRLAQLEAYKSSKSPRSNQSFASKCANLCRALLPAAKKAIQGISRYTAVLKVLGAITLFLLAGWLFTLFIRHFGF